MNEKLIEVLLEKITKLERELEICKCIANEKEARIRELEQRESRCRPFEQIDEPKDVF